MYKLTKEGSDSQSCPSRSGCSEVWTPNIRKNVVCKENVKGGVINNGGGGMIRFTPKSPVGDLLLSIVVSRSAKFATCLEYHQAVSLYNLWKDVCDVR